MSDQHPMILFVGHHERGARLLEAVAPMNWWVYQPETANEALGMYVGYLPDLVLLDADSAPDMAEEVYFHLASVQADPVIVVGGDGLWSDRVSHHLPSHASIEDVILSVAELTGAPVMTP